MEKDLDTPPTQESPTFWEGYNARRVGWNLHKDASPEYERGWRERNKIERQADAYNQQLLVFDTWIGIPK